MTNLKPCPFCGNHLDPEDEDTLYPSGVGWMFDLNLQMTTYHNIREGIPKQNWCWQIVCKCGAEMHGDSKQEAVDQWNTRSEPPVEGFELVTPVCYPAPEQ